MNKVLIFLLDSSVVIIAFFVYGLRITPVICTLLNLFIANLVVDYTLSGLKSGYRFEIITDSPEQLSQDFKKMIEKYPDTFVYYSEVIGVNGNFRWNKYDILK